MASDAALAALGLNGEDEGAWSALRKALADSPGFCRHRFEHVSETGSTNDDLKVDWRAPNPVQRIRVADHQTAGRGQAGRSWWDTPGASLLCSFSWPVEQDSPLVREFPASLVVGIALHQALCRILESSPPETGPWLKWPNDLWWEDAKVGGILVESSVSPAMAERHLVIGIGVNLWGGAGTLPTGEPRMTLETMGTSVGRPRLLAGILASWQELQQCPTEWPTLWMNAAGPFWKRNCEVTDPDGVSWTGRPLQLCPDGSLLLETPDQKARKLETFQRIRFVSPSGAEKKRS